MNSYLRNLEARQAIRNRIARQRRRLDRQLGRVSDIVLLFGSLRTFVQQHPGRSLIGAAGIGVLLAYLMSGQKSDSGPGQRLVEWFNVEKLTRLWRDFLNLFQSNEGTGTPNTDEVQNG
jgi:hypothetical protein